MSVRNTKTAMALILGAQAAIAWAGHRAWTRLDSWYRPPPAEWWRSSERPADLHVIAVPDAQREAAQTMLVNESFILLSATEASRLVGTTMTPDPGMTFYLLRAVYLNEGTGSFYVSQRGGVLDVHHGCLGRHAVPMKRAAVIVQLREAPSEVYVTCSMAE